MNKYLNKKTTFLHWGTIDYQMAWDKQEVIFKSVVDIKIANRKVSGESQKLTPNYLIFCEHPHVYTLGKSGDQKNLLLDEHGLLTHQATYHKINRGGDITYHGPGQIVGYPILDLENIFTDIHKYLRLLEEAIILTMNDYGVDGGRIDGLTGVWVDYKKQENPRKICAMGVKSSRWVTMHGFAFNVNTNLSYFKHIVPCGIEDKAVTSLSAEAGKTIDIKQVEERLKNHLSDLFHFELN